MSIGDDAEQSLDRAVEAPPKTDVLAPGESKATQEGAAELAGDRKRFLENSVGKAVSSSTEYFVKYLGGVGLSIYDGAKKIVGALSGERPKVSLPEARDTGTAVTAGEDLERAPLVAADMIFKIPVERIVGEYTGEAINRDVEPSSVTPAKGSRLKDVARDHLGPGASDEEINKHVREIARVNDIKNPNQRLDGTALSLPGHTKNGSFVSKDGDGNKRTVWPDGTVSVDHTDGTRYVRSPEEGGGYTENHYGRKPQDNYVVECTADGKYRVAECSPDGEIVITEFREPGENELDARVEKAKMRDLAEAKIEDPVARAQFQADLAKFDARQTELGQQYEKQGMSPEEAEKKANEEIAKTYREIRRLIEAPGNPDLPMIKEKHRILMAGQVLHQAAHPEDVSQGSYGTCNVTTIESRLYVKNPSEAAKLVTDVATTGKYTTKGDPPRSEPVTVDFTKPPERMASLKPHGDSARPHVPGENHRSYASQIFQVTAVNIHYEKANAKDGTDIRYEQRKPGPDKGADPDNGERLLNYKENDPKTGKPPAEVPGPDGKPARAPDLHPRQLVDVANEISPEPREGDQPVPVRIGIDAHPELMQEYLEVTNRQAALQLLIAGIGDGAPLNLNDPEVLKRTPQAINNKEGLDETKKQELLKTVDELERFNAYYNSGGIAEVTSEEQLHRALARLKADGRFPVQVGVHTGAEPFRGDAGDTSAGGGPHVVTITDYGAGPPARVKIDNQWSSSADRVVSVSELYKVMQFREVAGEIGGLINRSDQQPKTITDQELADGIVESAEKLHNIQNVSREEKDGLRAQMWELRDKLPPEEQQKVNDRITAMLAAGQP